MDPTELMGLISVAVVTVAGAVAGVLKVRANGRAKAEAEPEGAIIRADSSTGVEDTGRFLVALKSAPAPVLEDMARSLREIAGTKPATRDDVRHEVGALRDDINGKLDTHSAAIGGLRRDIVSLPCMQEPPSECPAYPGGNSGAQQKQ